MILYLYIYIYCEQLNPCSGSIVWSVWVPAELFPTFHANIAESSDLLLSALGSWAKHCVWPKVHWNIWELVLLYSHVHPICTPHVRHYVDLPDTKDGNLLISADVHMLELATCVVHPHRALAERYRIGIPATFLASQLAIGICTKEKVGNFELE